MKRSCESSINLMYNRIYRKTQNEFKEHVESIKSGKNPEKKKIFTYEPEVRRIWGDL
jgi:hypothetical protein